MTNECGGGAREVEEPDRAGYLWHHHTDLTRGVAQARQLGALTMPVTGN